MSAHIDDLRRDIERDRERHDHLLAASLDRVAASLDGIATQIEAEGRDRRANLAAIEFLMREMAIAFPHTISAGYGTVVGGTIEPGPIDLTSDAGPHTHTHPRQLPALSVMGRDGMHDDAELYVGCTVEVRSRFQNRWVEGFDVVEVITQDGVSRYRLARHADHIMLPVLFDATDLRPLDFINELRVGESDTSADAEPSR